jgi:hypothetical protein
MMQGVDVPHRFDYVVMNNSGCSLKDLLQESLVISYDRRGRPIGPHSGDRRVYGRY